MKLKMTYSKMYLCNSTDWFRRPDDPFQNWGFSQYAVDDIKANLGNIEGFTI